MGPTADPQRRVAARHPGLVLAAGLLLIGAAALAPAGLGGRPIPAASILIWCLVFVAALSVQRIQGTAPLRALRRLLFFVPFILFLALPAAFLAAPGHRLSTGLGLTVRAVAATSGGIALASWMGPVGLVAGLRQFRLPARLVGILAEALASLTLVTRQVAAMLRAREARRPGFGGLSSLLRAPVRTPRGFGRLVAALLLRSMERAEALDRARRARAAVDP